MSEQAVQKIKNLIEKRINYQISMYRMKPGANRRYYENLIEKNGREFQALGINVSEVDAEIKSEVETRGKMVAEMSLGKKWAIFLRHWAPVIFAAAGFAIYYYLFM